MNDMKHFFSLSFFCAIALNLFSLEVMPLIPISEPYYAYGGLRLDSFIVKDEEDASQSYKSVYQYSNDGRIAVGAYYHGYNTDTKQWIGSSKEEYTYYPGGSTIFRYYTWDTTTDEWILNQQVNDNYDSDEHNTSTIYFAWDNLTNSLTFSSKKEYSYNSGTLPTIIVSSKWNNYKWEKSEKIEYQYDENENMISAITCNYSNSAWIYKLKIIQAFDDQNRITSREIFQWNSTNKVWIAQMKYNYAYNKTDGKIYSETEWVWDAKQAKYIGYRKYKYTYDSNGYLTKKETQEETTGLYLWSTFMIDSYVRDANGNLLSQTGGLTSDNPTYYYEYTYDSNNNLLTATDYDWNETLSDWSVNEVSYHTYDSSNNLMTLKVYDATNNLKSTRTHYYAESNYSQIEVDFDYMYTWNAHFPINWYTGDSVGVVTKINNNSIKPFAGSIALQLVQIEDENISQLFNVIDFKEENIKAYNNQFVRFDGQIKVPAGNYIQTILFRNNENEDWQLVGATEGHENPTIFVVSDRSEIKQYVILAQRRSTSNWFYLTSANVGSEETPHLEAIDAGTNDKQYIATSKLADKYIWQIEENLSGNIYLKNRDSYISWTRGNTAFMSDSGTSLTEEASAIEGQTQYFFTDSEAKFYLSLNKDTRYNYFSFYKGTQAQDLLFLEYKSQQIPTLEDYIHREETNCNKPTKVICNGQILILLPDGRTYNTLGTEVK